jgi:hypothetical protein
MLVFFRQDHNGVFAMANQALALRFSDLNGPKMRFAPSMYQLSGGNDESFSHSSNMIGCDV